MSTVEWLSLIIAALWLTTIFLLMVAREIVDKKEMKIKKLKKKIKKYEYIRFSLRYPNGCCHNPNDCIADPKRDNKNQKT